MQQTTSTTDPGLDLLVRTVRSELSRPGDPATRVGRALETAPPTLAVLAPSQCRPQPDRTTSHIVHRERSFSLVALVLAPGQRTTIHDHLTWCVVTVVQGTESETRYDDRGDHLEVAGISHNVTGSVSVLAPPGDIHRVHNEQSVSVISLHVYGIDVGARGSSVRRVHHLPVLPTRRRRSS